MYYTDRDYEFIDNNYFFYKTARLRLNNIFRSFLIKENADNTSKYIRNKKKEILPEYSNIKKKFNHHISEIKSYFDIENTIFKEIKSKDILAYSKFAKDLKAYLFGPKGMITQKNYHLKKYYNSQGMSKIGLNTKIYAGRWEFLEENLKYSRYIQRLKSNHKKILNIGGHFSTEEDVGHKVHDLYLKRKAKKENKINENRKNLEKNRRRHSLVNDINQLKIFNKNIFEFTAIDSITKRNSVQGQNYYSKSPASFHEKKKINIINNSSTTQNKSKDKTLSEIRHKKLMLNKIKNIFKKEKIKRQINKENKRHFKKLKININTKLNLVTEPSKNLLEKIYTIKKNNETNYNFRNNKNKYKEDIKVIGEDDKRDNDENMNIFLKTNYKNQLIKKNSSIPAKIHFSYYDRSKLHIHNSIKDFIRNIGKVKQEEREKRYGKNIRDQFQNNIKTIKQLVVNLETLTSKGYK